MSEPLQFAVGKRIRAVRRQAGRKQGDVARAAHIGQSTLSLYELGKREVSLSAALVLARALNVSILDLIPEAS